MVKNKQLLKFSDRSRFESTAENWNHSHTKNLMHDVFFLLFHSIQTIYGIICVLNWSLLFNWILYTPFFRPFRTTHIDLRWFYGFFSYIFWFIQYHIHWLALQALCGVRFDRSLSISFSLCFFNCLCLASSVHFVEL